MQSAPTRAAMAWQLQQQRLVAQPWRQRLLFRNIESLWCRTLSVVDKSYGTTAYHFTSEQVSPQQGEPSTNELPTDSGREQPSPIERRYHIHVLARGETQTENNQKIKLLENAFQNRLTIGNKIRRHLLLFRTWMMRSASCGRSCQLFYMQEKMAIE